MNQATIKALITKAESDGRSDIALWLSGHLQTPCEPEFLRYRYTPSKASGGRRSWARRVTRYDPDETTPARRFVGDYLREHAEMDLPVGGLVLEVTHKGSVKRGWREAQTHIVGPDDLYPVGGAYDYEDDHLSLVDHVKDLFANPPDLAEVMREEDDDDDDDDN